MNVSGVCYNVNITYDIDGATNRIRVGDLPDSDITLAATTIAAFLNTLPNDDAFLTDITLQPNLDTITLAAGQYQFNDIIRDNTSGDDNWSTWNSGIPSENAQFGSGTTNARVGYAVFTAVPEPSAAAYIGICLLGIGFYQRCNKIVSE